MEKVRGAFFQSGGDLIGRGVDHCKRIEALLMIKLLNPTLTFFLCLPCGFKTLLEVLFPPQHPVQVRICSFEYSLFPFRLARYVH
jgi:hypothetical protein